VRLCLREGILPRNDTLLKDRAESQPERPLHAEGKQGITAGGVWLLEQDEEFVADLNQSATQLW
jgi:hypothetical protein